MSDITRRDALKLGAATLVAATVPAPIVAEAAPSPLPAWVVGTPGEWDWQVARGATEEEAILDYLAERGCGIVCEAVECEEEPSPPEDCDCEFCYVKRGVEAERKPMLDAISKPSKAQTFEAGLGQNCDRCGYETYPDDNGRAVGGLVICEDCMTLADWEIVDPERAKERREEVTP